MRTSSRALARRKKTAPTHPSNVIKGLPTEIDARHPQCREVQPTRAVQSQGSANRLAGRGGGVGAARAESCGGGVGGAGDAGSG